MAKAKTTKVVKKRPTKKKLTPIGLLKKKLWLVYSEYIRLSHADSAGTVSCVACNNKYNWSGTGNLHCGHFFSKRFYSCIMFEEMNTKPLCNSCNRKQSSGEGYLYYLYLVKLYGEEAVKQLFEKGQSKVPYTREQLQEKLDYYTEKLKALKTNLNL